MVGVRMRKFLVTLEALNEMEKEGFEQVACSIVMCLCEMNARDCVECRLTRWIDETNDKIGQIFGIVAYKAV